MVLVLANERKNIETTSESQLHSVKTIVGTTNVGS